MIWFPGVRMKPACLWWVHAKGGFCGARPAGFRLSFPENPESVWVFVCRAHGPAELILRA